MTVEDFLRGVDFGWGGDGVLGLRCGGDGEVLVAVGKCFMRYTFTTLPLDIGGSD